MFMMLPLSLAMGVVVTPSTSFKLAGAIPPLGYFDPLGVTAKIEESRLKYIREAELQHGRVAMLSFITLVGLDATSSTLAINQLSDLEWQQQITYWFRVSVLEFARMSAGWSNPFTSEKQLFRIVSAWKCFYTFEHLTRRTFKMS